MQVTQFFRDVPPPKAFAVCLADAFLWRSGSLGKPKITRHITP